jgi:hypothetical protein
VCATQLSLTWAYRCETLSKRFHTKLLAAAQNKVHIRQVCNNTTILVKSLTSRCCAVFEPFDDTVADPPDVESYTGTQFDAD